MKHCSLAILFVLLVATLSSCGQSIPLEDLTISLILGIDLDNKNNLIISESSPVFSKEAKKNNEVYQLEAKSIRESRKYFDTLATGDVTAAKIQVLLLGRSVLEHEGWFSILDTVYRNPAFSINTRVIIVDGPVADVILFEPEDKPGLALHLKEVIDKNNEKSVTEINTLQLLHRQMYEKGMTPTIPEIKKEKDVELVGVAMLDEKGKYVDTLSIDDSSTLLILKNQHREQLTFTIPMPLLNREKGIFNKNELSIDVSKVKTKVKTKYDQDQFHFDYKIDMTVNIVERLFPEDMVKEEELKKMIEKELVTRFESVIKKFQKNKIDPIGLGLHARAYEYDQYKKVKDHWGETLAESNIDVSLDVKIKSTGAVK